MSHHVVTILQKNYNIACSENEIPRLQECAGFINNILQKITKNGRINSENTLMAMALLTIADELLDLKQNNSINIPLDKPKEIIECSDFSNSILLKLENLCKKMEVNI